MKHLTAAELSAMLDAALPAPRRSEIERHLTSCAGCREALAALAAQDRELGTALAHDPGEEYFETFAARVMARLEEGPREIGAGEARRGWLDRLATPRGLAWAGAAAAVVVAAGIVLVTGRDASFDAARDPGLAARSGQVAAPPAAPEPGAAGPSAGSERAGEPPAEQLQAVPVPEPQGPAPTRLEDGAAARVAPRAATPEATAPAPAEARSRPSREARPDRAVRVRNGQRDETAADRFAAPPPGEAGAPVPGQPRKPAAAPLAPSADEAPQEAREEARRAPEAAKAPQPRLGFETRSGPPPVTLPYERARLCGTVVDDAGRPVARASVAIAEFGITATTGRDGAFCLEAPVGEHTLAVMAVGFAPARRAVTVAEDGERPRVELRAVPVLEGPSAYRAALDTFAGWPAAARERARAAERLATRASRSRSAADHDRAAEAWAQTLAAARGSAVEIHARHHLADARYRAWSLAPSARRAAAAIEALAAYVARAPLGAAREEAARRLDQVRR